MPAGCDTWPLTMTKSIRRLLFVMGGVATALLGAGVVVLSVGRTPESPLPNPNGYDDFLKAGHTVTGKLYDLAELDHAGLQVLVATNAEALRLLRVGLSRRCAVPTDKTIANFGATAGDLMGLKSLAMLLSAEGRLAKMENRLAERLFLRKAV